MTRPLAFALAAAGASATAAMLLPGSPAGLGWVLAALALAVAAALAQRPADPLRSSLLGLLALALAASAALRDASWVVTGELVAALVLGSIAIGALRTWRATWVAALAPVLRLRAGARRVGSALAAALPHPASGGHGVAVGRGLLLTGALLAIFGALFASGDRAFAQLAGNLLPSGPAFDDMPLRLIVFGVVVALAGALAQAAAVADEPARAPLLRLGRIEWRLALVSLNGLFALFVGVQIAVLFGGDSYVRETAGETYAEYARSGFAQLVVVGLLTLAVVAGALRWSRTQDAREARLLRALLAALCLLTLVVLASALHRLGLYEQAFGYTRTRLAVHALLLFGGALFVLVIAALASGRRAWLARATVVLAGVFALVFWAGDPDRRIAAHNVERFGETGRIDTGYLSQLSADAVPALARLPEPQRERALGPQRSRLERVRDGFAGANLARGRARDAIAALP